MSIVNPILRKAMSFPGTYLTPLHPHGKASQLYAGAVCSAQTDSSPKPISQRRLQAAPLDMPADRRNAWDELLSQRIIKIDEQAGDLQALTEIINWGLDRELLPPSYREILISVEELIQDQNPVLSKEGGGILEQLYKRKQQELNWHQLAYLKECVEMIARRHQEGRPAHEDLIRQDLFANVGLSLQEHDLTTLNKMCEDLHIKATESVQQTYQALVHHFLRLQTHDLDLIQTLLNPEYIQENPELYGIDNPIIGLHNLGGNDCWINSWLQFTAKTPALQDMVSDLCILAEKMGDPREEPLKRIHSEMLCFLNESRSLLPPKISTANTLNIRYALNDLFPQISREHTEQDDPAQIIELLEALRSELSEKNRHIPISDSSCFNQALRYIGLEKNPQEQQEQYVPFKDMADSTVFDILGQKVLPVATRSCFLSLSGGRGPMLPEMARAFLKEVNGDLTQGCFIRDKEGNLESYKPIADPRAIASFDHPPEQLIVQIRPATSQDPRTGQVEIVPNQTNDTPAIFSLSKSLCGRRDTSYALEHIIFKTGGANGGHYVVIQKQGGNWYFCSDTRTLQVSAELVEREFLPKGTILLYKKLDQIDADAPLIDDPERPTVADVRRASTPPAEESPEINNPLQSAAPSRLSLSQEIDGFTLINRETDTTALPSPTTSIKQPLKIEPAPPSQPSNLARPQPIGLFQRFTGWIWEVGTRVFSWLRKWWR